MKILAIALAICLAGLTFGSPALAYNPCNPEVQTCK